MKKGIALLITIAAIGLFNPMAVNAQNVTPEVTTIPSSDNESIITGIPDAKNESHKNLESNQKTDVEEESKKDKKEEWYSLSFQDILMQIIVGVVLFVVPGCIIFYRAKKN